MAQLGVIGGPWWGQCDYSAPMCRHAVMYEGMKPPRTWRANKVSRRIRCRRSMRSSAAASFPGVTFGAYEPPTPESPFRCEDLATAEYGGSAPRQATKGLEPRREARQAVGDGVRGGCAGAKPQSSACRRCEPPSFLKFSCFDVISCCRRPTAAMRMR